MRTIALLVSLMFGAFHLSASDGRQNPGVEIRNDYVTISAFLDVRGLAYTRPESDLPVAFVGEPLVLEIRVRNNRPQPLTLAAPGGDSWVGAVAFDVGNRMQGKERAADVVFVEPAASVTGPTIVTLEPGSGALARFAIRRAKEQPFEPGHYHFTVTLNSRAVGGIALRTDDDLNTDVEFVVKHARTAEELADEILHRSYRAIADRNFAEGRDWAEKLLAINPDSLPAITDIATAWRREGNCDRARPMFERALTILASGGDPAFRFRASVRDEWAGNLRGQLKTCQ